jgi:EAL domain-containing protein (putative c-di-GMP-specific phosphodiesterase class I)
MEVIAEGVETPASLARLRELKADFGQGYLFSPPVDAQAATRLLASGPHW